MAMLARISMKMTWWEAAASHGKTRTLLFFFFILRLKVSAITVNVSLVPKTR
jgi:hypothetical protein